MKKSLKLGFFFLYTLSLSFQVSALNQVQKDYKGTAAELYTLCSGKLDNDELAALCEGFPKKDNFIKVGAERTEDTFEKLMGSLSREVEMKYHTIILVNTKDPQLSKDEDRLVPAQKMLILERKYRQVPLFIRDGLGKPTGEIFKFNARVASEVLASDESDLWDAKKEYDRDLSNYIVKGNNGLEYFDVTSGRVYGSGFLPTASGIFPINVARSEGRNDRYRKNSPEAPMSNALYFGYLYGNRPDPILNFTQEDFMYRTSGMAIHGTPSRFWGLLGQARGSHGCVRTHPVVAEKIYDHVMNMNDEEVPLLQWDLPEAKTYTLEDNNTLMNETKPVLIITFNGYDAISA